MPDKKLVLLFMFIGSSLGGFIPTFFGADIFSLWSMGGTLVGGVIGIYLAFKIVS